MAEDDQLDDTIVPPVDDLDLDDPLLGDSDLDGEDLDSADIDSSFGDGEEI